MTCIVGLEHNGRVYIGADSAGVSGWDLTVRADKKVFRNGSFLFGFTDSFRMRTAPRSSARRRSNAMEPNTPGASDADVSALLAEIRKDAEIDSAMFGVDWRTLRLLNVIALYRSKALAILTAYHGSDVPREVTSDVMEQIDAAACRILRGDSEVTPMMTDAEAVRALRVKDRDQCGEDVEYCGLCGAEGDREHEHNCVWNNALSHIERRLALLEKVREATIFHARKNSAGATYVSGTVDRDHVVIEIDRATWNAIRGETDGGGE